MKFTRMFASSLCGMVLASSAIAQQSSALPTSNATQSKDANGSHSLREMVTTCLALDNQETVILAKLAIEKSQDKDVSAFAKKMVESHEKCMQDLVKLEPSLANRKLLSDSSSATGERSSTSARPGSSQATMNAKPDMLQLQTEMAQQCLADTKVMLNKDGGKHFDECYVGMQIAKHASMHSKLTVLERHTTGELKDLVTKGLAMTKDHLAQAESLMKSLEGNDNNSKTTGK